jgi:hypothetical protein
MNEPITPLDKALAVARQDSENKIAFYNTFLGSELFIPTLDQPVQDSTLRRSQAGEKFMPYVIEHNGKKYLPVFDSFERLSKWIQKQATYVAMPAHALVCAIHGDLYFKLNTGTDFTKEFNPEEIQWLRNTVEQAQPKIKTVPTGTKFFVGAPAQIPAGLEQALRNCLQHNFEICYAYLGQVYLEAPGEKPHLVVTLEADKPIESVVENIRLDVGVALKPFIQKDAYIGIAFLGIDRIASDIKQATKPFYSRLK